MESWKCKPLRPLVSAFSISAVLQTAVHPCAPLPNKCWLVNQACADRGVHESLYSSEPCKLTVLPICHLIWLHNCVWRKSTSDDFVQSWKFRWKVIVSKELNLLIKSCRFIIKTFIFIVNENDMACVGEPLLSGTFLISANRCLQIHFL